MSPLHRQFTSPIYLLKYNLLLLSLQRILISFTHIDRSDIIVNILLISPPAVRDVGQASINSTVVISLIVSQLLCIFLIIIVDGLIILLVQ